ncbi:hypothetical protein [Mesobacillus harenae]|uniref:hypothetical protein n=1 Tax=Mesobacillus harenae TaxID=2213203 RepID=UPI0015808A0A|nr:hypothetical protein [Mesobacillus harenae]
MFTFLVFVLITNAAAAAWIYFSLGTKRYLFNERFAFSITLAASTYISLVTGLNLFLLFPNEFLFISTFNLFLGIGIGILFGSMVNMQSLIAGFYNGGIGGVMGSMIGAVALDPSLCGLPASLWTEQSMVLFMSLLSLVVQGLSSIILLFSMKA